MNEENRYKNQNLIIRTLFNIVKKYNKKYILQNIFRIPLFYGGLIGGIFLIVFINFIINEESRDYLFIFSVIMAVTYILVISFSIINDKNTIIKLVAKDINLFSKEEKIVLSIIEQGGLIRLFQDQIFQKEQSIESFMFIQRINGLLFNKPETFDEYISLHKDIHPLDLCYEDKLIFTIVSLTKPNFKNENYLYDFFIKGDDINVNIVTLLIDKAYAGHRIVYYLQDKEEILRDIIDSKIKENFQEKYIKKLDVIFKKES